MFSTTYYKYPANYWKYGTVHITSGTPTNAVENIATSNVTTGSIILETDFTATPTSNTQFKIFAPIKRKIKDAQCEQALFIVENKQISTVQDYKNLGAEEVRIGDVSVRFREGSTSKLSISSTAKKLMSRWIRRHKRIQRA